MDVVAGDFQRWEIAGFDDQCRGAIASLYDAGSDLVKSKGRVVKTDDCGHVVCSVGSVDGMTFHLHEPGGHAHSLTISDGDNEVVIFRRSTTRHGAFWYDMEFNSEEGEAVLAMSIMILS